MNIALIAIFFIGQYLGLMRQSLHTDINPGLIRQNKPSHRISLSGIPHTNFNKASSSRAFISHTRTCWAESHSASIPPVLSPVLSVLPPVFPTLQLHSQQSTYLSTCTTTTAILSHLSFHLFPHQPTHLRSTAPTFLPPVYPLIFPPIIPSSHLLLVSTFLPTYLLNCLPTNLPIYHPTFPYLSNT